MSLIPDGEDEEIGGASLGDEEEEDLELEDVELTGDERYEESTWAVS